MIENNEFISRNYPPLNELLEIKSMHLRMNKPPLIFMYDLEIDKDEQLQQFNSQIGFFFKQAEITHNIKGIKYIF